MTSTEKKCCGKCSSLNLPRLTKHAPVVRDKFCIYGGNCPCHYSDKPVQEKLLSGHRGVSHAESIAPVVEEWAGKLMDEFCVMFERAGRVTDANDLVWVVKMEAFISKLLQAEREKADQEGHQRALDTFARRAEDFKEKYIQKGAKAERQRIEDAVMKLPNIEVETFSGNRQVKVELNAITRAAVLKVIREEDIKS